VRALVTGVAGFIGSNLADDLLRGGHEVVGVDSLVPYYPLAQKEGNLEALRSVGGDAFRFEPLDLASDRLDPVLDEVDVVFHLAGQPGVRLSWSEGFARYERSNITATQRLLEAVRGRSLRRFVFASSSSIYGNATRYPTAEDDLPHPHSPYGVTKLAAEHLCGLYAEVHEVPVVSLRYFTVYGPGQRPDMLMHRLFEDALDHRPVPIFGAGDQAREFTFVSDVVAANLCAVEADVPAGSVVNVAGGSTTTVAAVIEMVGDLLGVEVPVERLPAQAGDVERTGGSIERARALLGWEPHVDLRTGLAAQLAWHRARRPAVTPPAGTGA
jgi:nucleoside-diphosphate-sugar epimerase